MTEPDQKPPAAGREGVPPRRRTFNEAAHKIPLSAPQRESESDEEIFDNEPAADDPRKDVVAHASRAVLALGALGVVYGDIGTSPLYAEQVTFGFKAARHVTAAGAYGIVSLIFWSLAIVVSIKYAGIIMRAHNRGDGGIMALASLVRRNKLVHATLLVTLGIFGASLFFGDGMITPAISVLSAVSGLEVATPGVTHLVVPIAVAILVALFILQRRGTGTVGWLFGPVTLLWFVSISAIGIPRSGQPSGCAPGALSDLGRAVFHRPRLRGVPRARRRRPGRHRSRGALRRPWPLRPRTDPVCLVHHRLAGGPAQLPGSGGVDHRPPEVAAEHEQVQPVLLGCARTGSSFPEVVLATVATVIASQAVISGSYTVARQAMQLGYLPRLRIVHTSEMEGQIYVPVINWILAGRRDRARAHLPELQRPCERLRRRRDRHVHPQHRSCSCPSPAPCGTRPSGGCALLGALFLTVEVAFFLANVAKLFHGAWLPLAAGIVSSTVMLTWRRAR